MKREVLLFEVSPDKFPVQDFLKSLSAKEQQKIVWTLKLLEDGFLLKEPHFKKISNVEQLWEARISFGGNAFRILFFEWKPNIVVLTNGFQKKTEKTPKNEIELAEKYIKIFLEDKNENT